MIWIDRKSAESAEVTRRRFILLSSAVLTLPFLAPGGANANRGPARYPDIIGETRFVVTIADDTLLDIARRHHLGYTELIAANPGIDPWLPGAGVRLLLPTAHILPLAAREGLILNLADQRLYHFPTKGGPPESVPIGIGRQGWKTPLGRTKIVRKRKDPNWYVPESIRKEQPDLPRVVKAGPENPLGSHALYLAWPAYLIHGTNNPWGVGRRVSHGCVRLYPEDISRLFGEIEKGTPVSVVDQPAKIGWRAGELFLEVHPSQSQSDQLETGDRVTPEPVPELEYMILDAAGDQAGRLDWSRIRKAVRNRRGIPISVFKPRPLAGGPDASEPRAEPH